MDSRTKQSRFALFLLLTILVGSVYSVIQKLQNLTPGEGGLKFDHPYFVTFLLSISQVLVFFVYLAKERIFKNQRPRSNS